MVGEGDESIEVENDEQEVDNTIEVNDNCMENPTAIPLRSAIEVLRVQSFYGVRRGSTLHNENFRIDRK